MTSRELCFPIGSCDRQQSSARSFLRKWRTLWTYLCSVPRSILRAPFQASKSVMFEQLTWPSLRWRREILCITLFHLILHTRPPPLDSCLFPFASTNTVRSTRKPKQLILPRVRPSRYVKSFFFRSALLWNTLPANLQNITCHRKFKKNIEAHWSAHKYSTKFCLLP